MFVRPQYLLSRFPAPEATAGGRAGTRRRFFFWAAPGRRRSLAPAYLSPLSPVLGGGGWGGGGRLFRKEHPPHPNPSPPNTGARGSSTHPRGSSMSQPAPLSPADLELL